MQVFVIYNSNTILKPQARKSNTAVKTKNATNNHHNSAFIIIISQNNTSSLRKIELETQFSVNNITNTNFKITTRLILDSCTNHHISCCEKKGLMNNYCIMINIWLYLVCYCNLSKSISKLSSSLSSNRDNLILY